MATVPVLWVPCDATVCVIDEGFLSARCWVGIKSGVEKHRWVLGAGERTSAMRRRCTELQVEFIRLKAIKM